VVRSKEVGCQNDNEEDMKGAVVIRGWDLFKGAVVSIYRALFSWIG